MRAPLPLWIPLDAGPPFDCPYLGERQARFDLGATLPSPDDVDRLMGLGYRRSGRLFYLPACPGGCRACTPIRVPVAGFTPSRSQRRLLRRSAGRVVVDVVEPRFSAEDYDVYLRHHERVSPGDEPASPDGYRWSFVDTCVDTRFVEFRVDGRLAALSVLDVGRTTASSVYCSWDPEFAALGPGALSVLWEIDWCRRSGLDRYHLGYWIEGCRRLEYKDRFRPCEVLDWESGVWRAHDLPGSRVR